MPTQADPVGNGKMDHVVPGGACLVVKTLAALGVTKVFGIPGQHSLSLFQALPGAGLVLVSSRVENNAGFEADGYARETGRPGVLLLSTGPGALTALPALQEAHATSVPVIAIVSQVPVRGLGGRRNGMLHQLDDQQASAHSVTKHTAVVTDARRIPDIIARAWQLAVTPPHGPVWIEIPQDVLLADVPADDLDRPAVVDQGAVRADPGRLDVASDILRGSLRPLIVAGGGVTRSRAAPEVLELAESLRAPVVCTPGGHGAFPWGHPLSLQGWVEDRAVTEDMNQADALIVVGSSLGEVTSNYYTLRPRGEIIQVDADPRVLGSNHPVTGLCGDAAQILRELIGRLPKRPADGSAEREVRRVLASVRSRLDAQDLTLERKLLGDLRQAVPDGMSTYWDMTILSYWAWSAWDPRDGRFESAQGAGGLGFAFPAALGAAAGAGKRVLAVSGDGGAMYGIAELASAKQHALPVTWLIIDDGGYGILSEYMQNAFGGTFATQLHRPDFCALANAFGVPAWTATCATIRDVMAHALVADGPNVIVLRVKLRMFAPTHMSTSAARASASAQPARR